MDPFVEELRSIITEQRFASYKVGIAAGLSSGTVSAWLRYQYQPRLAEFNRALAPLGYRLKIERIEK